jgi:ABC-type phosphate transport system substrate-binding protein
VDFFRWEVVLAVLGVLVPITAALYEFLLIGRKRLGYRVQMDTTATDAVHSAYAGALAQLRGSGGLPLVDPSFVLLRIENVGATNIDEHDYAVLDDDRVGIRVSFPGRRVSGTVVTELSSDSLRPCFEGASGMRVQDGVIHLPKVPLNRGAHYKVLAALEREPTAGPLGAGEEFTPPRVVGSIKGGVGTGDIKETRSRTGTTSQSMVLISFLVVLIIGQYATSVLRDDTAAPLDCAGGELLLTGSTAFGPVLEEAAGLYAETCPDAVVTVRTEGSGQGLDALTAAGEASGDGTPGMLAFTDGPKSDEHPRLLQSPVAFSLFTLVVHESTGVRDLTLEQIRGLYDGTYTNWSQLNGADLPVRLVGRHSGSGSRVTFEKQVLGGVREPGDTSDNCRELAPGTEADAVIRCEESGTTELLTTVATTEGTIGYAEAGTAADHPGLLPLRIDGHSATLENADHGAYPFWETEYAYTYGDVEADALPASFLRYLTNEVGRDIVRSHGHHPCAELRNPVRCQPV